MFFISLPELSSLQYTNAAREFVHGNKTKLTKNVDMGRLQIDEAIVVWNAFIG